MSLQVTHANLTFIFESIFLMKYFAWIIYHIHMFNYMFQTSMNAQVTHVTVTQLATTSSTALRARVQPISRDSYAKQLLYNVSIQLVIGSRINMILNIMFIHHLCQIYHIDFNIYYIDMVECQNTWVRIGVFYA